MKEDVTCQPATLESEDLLFLLYTSGSTGKPKGLVHSQAGYLLYAALTHKVKHGGILQVCKDNYILWHFICDSSWVDWVVTQH